MTKLFFLILIFTTTLFGDYYYAQGKKQGLTKLSAFSPLRKNRSIQAPINYYKTTAGKRLGVNNTLIVAFKDLSTQLYIEKEFSLSMLEQLSSHMFLYQIKDKDKTLEIANLLRELPSVKFAQPNFIKQKESRTRDPHFNASWHLDNNRGGINVEEAWQEGAQGEGVIVAVYDEGIDITHEDLRANILGYGNFDNSDGQIDIISPTTTISNSLHNAPAPAPKLTADGRERYIWHGTSCAGLIAAVGDNYKGSVGVAPKAKLLAIRYASDTKDDIKAFKAMARKGTAIISNSWGTYHIEDAFNEVLKEISITGRNGKGVLIFFAAGNDGCNMDAFYRVAADGSNVCLSEREYQNYNVENKAPIQDESESPYVISIAASTQNNRIASYSNYGSSIDFTAPGSQPASIVTTDATGRAGSSSGSYTFSFSGTSAAAPIAAGVAALILSSNPELTKEEVIDILKETAQHIGNYRYQNGRNDHWGYGRIDAGKAVKLAKTYGKSSKIENFAHKIYQAIR